MIYCRPRARALVLVVLFYRVVNMNRPDVRFIAFQGHVNGLYAFFLSPQVPSPASLITTR